MKKSYLTAHDFYAGCGGEGQGMFDAGYEILVAANHWPLALESYGANLPWVPQDCVDLMATDPRRYPRADFAWFSPECTFHSQAGGRKRPRKQLDMFEDNLLDPSAVRSRCTMYTVLEFAEYHDYDALVVENVNEIRKWIGWDGWYRTLLNMDYNVRCLYLNSMFFGVPQSRDRLYVVAWKKDLPEPDLEIRPRACCEKCGKEVGAVQTWKNPNYIWGAYDGGPTGKEQKRQYTYRCPHCTGLVFPYATPAFVAIDWSDPGVRIGDREKEGMQPLKPNTLKRIQQGLDKYGDQWLIVELAYSHAKNVRAQPATWPMTTQTSQQTKAVAMPFLASVNYFRPNSPVDKPLPTQTTGNQHALTIPPGAVIVFRRDKDGESLGDPLTAITAGAINHGLALPPSSLVSLKSNGREYDPAEPMPTIVAAGSTTGIARMPWLTLNYSPGYSKPVTDPLATVTATDHHSLLQAAPFLISYYKHSNPSGVDEPLPTIPTRDRHAVVRGKPELEDCYFRMLKVNEIKPGMGFWHEYIVLGTQREQVKQCGNAVTPPVAEDLTLRMRRVHE